MSERRIGISFDVNSEDLQKLEKAVSVMDSFNKKVSSLQQSAGTVATAYDRMSQSTDKAANKQQSLTKMMREFDTALNSQKFTINTITTSQAALSKRLEEYGRNVKVSLDETGKFKATLETVNGQVLKLNGSFDATTNKLTNVQRSVKVTNNYLQETKKAAREAEQEMRRMEGLDISSRLPSGREWNVQKDALVSYGKVIKASIDRNDMFTQVIVKQNGEVNKITGYYNRAKGALVQYNNEVSKASKSQMMIAGFDNSAVNRIGTMAESMKGLNKYTLSWSEAMAISATRMVQWGIAGSAIYGVQNALQSMMGTIIELDTQMTSLRRVLDDDVNMDNLFEGAIRNAGILGIKLTEINESMIEFGRQGFDESQIETLVKATGMMKNVADMDMTKASENITAYLATFHKGVEDTMGYVDRLNEVDNKYAVSVDQLSDSVRKAGGTANAFGVTIDNLVGYTTAIGESTRESGAIIGNSLKTIFSRMTTNSQAVKALDQVGISMEGVGGKSKTVDQILAELHGKWGSLTEAEKQNTAVKVAGTHQLNRFLVLMQNYDEAMKASKTSTQSWGSAARENAKYMESLQAKINQLWTSLQLLAKAVGDSGIGKAFGIIIESSTMVIQGFTKLVDSIGGFTLVIPAASAVLMALGHNFVTLKNNTDMLKNGMTPVNTAVTSMASSMGATTQTATILGGAVGKLTMTLKGLALATVANPLFWIPIAVSAIVGYVGHLDQVKQHQEDLNKSTKDANKEYKAFLDSVNSGKIEPYDLEKYKSQIDALKESQKDLTKIAKESGIQMLTQGAQYTTLGYNADMLGLSKAELSKKYAEETSAMKVLNDTQESQIASMGIKITKSMTMAEVQDKLKAKEDEVSAAVKRGEEALKKQKMEAVVPTTEAYQKLTQELDENATSLENAMNISDKLMKQMKEQRAIIELLAGVKNKDAGQQMLLNNAYDYWANVLGVSREELKKHPELMDQNIKKNQELMDLVSKIAEGTATAEEKKRAQQLQTAKNTEETAAREQNAIRETEKKRIEAAEKSMKKWREAGDTFNHKMAQMNKDSRLNELTTSENFRKQRESLQQTIDKFYSFGGAVKKNTDSNKKNLKSEGAQADATGNKHKAFAKTATGSSNTVKGSLDSMLKNSKTNFSGVRGQIDQTKTKNDQLSKNSKGTATSVNNANSSIHKSSKTDLSKTRDQVDKTKKKYGELEDEAKNIPKGIAKGILNAISDPEKAIAKLAETLVKKFKKALGIHSPSRVFMAMGGHILDGLINGLDVDNMKKLGMNVFKDFADGAFNTVESVKGFLTGNFGGMMGKMTGGAKAWKPMIIAAAKQMGQSLSDREINGIIAQISRESGGNQSIIQSSAVRDINTMNGNPARGLLQYIPQTFNAYKVPGFGNIYNGYHQLLAFFNNSSWRRDLPYGTRGWGPRGSRLFANGGLTGKYIEQASRNGSMPNGGFVNKPVFVDGGRGIAGEAGPEAIIPLSAQKRGRATELYDKVGDILGMKGYANGGITGGLYKYGSRGSMVKEIQKILGVAVDGIFGKNTLAAVKKFQKTMGLAIDGIVGKNTIAKLNAKSGGSSSSGSTSSKPKTYFSTAAKAEAFLSSGQGWASDMESLGLRGSDYRVRTMTSAKYREAFQKTNKQTEYNKMVIDGLSTFSNANDAKKLFNSANLFLNSTEKARALKNILSDIAQNALNEVNEKTTAWLDNFNSKVIETNDSIKGLIDVSNQVNDRKAAERQDNFTSNYVSGVLSSLGVADKVDPATAMQQQADALKAKIESRANENAMLEWRLSSALIDPRKAQLQNYMNQLNNQISSTKKDFSSRGVTDSTTINSALKPLQDRLAEVKSEYDDLMYSIDNSNKALSDNKSELEDLAKQYKELQDQISATENKREFTDVWGNLVRDADGNVKSITEQGQLIMNTYAKVKQEIEAVKAAATGSAVGSTVSPILDQLSQAVAAMSPTINTNIDPATAIVNNTNSSSSETKTYEANTNVNRNVTYVVQAGVVLASESEMKEFAMIIKDMIDEEEGRSKS
ncbi:phage tail tape measure protein [Priestia megaterium]|uniref:phage tail tape measure protein n=1 Tax=Priestia megaterium TaxID=1404 RepID=UPI00279633C2|nr:phage tail tape measure protein [Priestia megaterium]